jgi:spore coat protein I
VDALVHFERFTKGNQLNDLYQFTRKAMEKNHFELELLTRLLLAYDEVIPLSKEDYRYIYILFSYPEKFWKIANGYYNTNKAFLSPKYVEKLQNVIWQEEEKREMLKEYFAFHLQ